MGMFEDSLDVAMAVTRARMGATGEDYETAARNVRAGLSYISPGNKYVHETAARVFVDPLKQGLNQPEATPLAKGIEALAAYGETELWQSVKTPEPSGGDHISAWMPEQNTHIVAMIGKLGEELNEAAARCFRILISGYQTPDPDTGNPNWYELQQELADVTACLNHAADNGLTAVDHDRERIDKKVAGFVMWGNLIDAELTKGNPVGWECKDYADGWIPFKTLDEALLYQAQTGCVMRPVKG